MAALWVCAETEKRYLSAMCMFVKFDGGPKFTLWMTGEPMVSAETSQISVQLSAGFAYDTIEEAFELFYFPYCS